MKNTKIMAVLVVLLAAMLFAGAASAAGDYVNVSSGGSAFVYEKIYLNDTTASSAMVLTKFSEGSNPTAVNTIYADNAGNFSLYASSVNGQYGTYYAADAWDANNMSNTFRVSIWYPEISLKAELTTGGWGVTSGDSIDGKTINKNTNVTFLIDTPMVGPANVNDRFGDLKAKIVFTTPVGGKTTVFGALDNGTVADYNGISVTTSQNIAGSAIPDSEAAAGTYTAQAEFINYKPFADNAEKSNTISFTIQSTSLSLVADKDSVIRSNPFTVTVQGDSQMVYFVYIDGASASDVNPTLQQGQSGWVSTSAGSAVDNGATLVATGGNLADTYGYFETDASGKRTVQYNTLDNTDDKTYTIKVYETGMKKAAVEAAEEVNIHGNDYDSVKVKVEKGAVTISASGDGSYYIGEEIKLSGTNTDSDTIYLFITGPNLINDGEVLKQLPTHVAAFTNRNADVSVKTDNTWEYKWDTSGCGLDTGAYTIYATSVLTNGKSSSKYDGDSYTAIKLSDSEYATVSVNLKQPFLSAVPSGTVVAKGDKIYIRGTAEGDPSTLMLYIFGPNKYVRDTITVEDDGTYEKKLDIGSEWSSNQYFVVIEHPMYNGVIDVNEVDYSTYKTLEIKNFGANQSEVGLQGSFVVEGTNKLQGSKQMHSPR